MGQEEILNFLRKQYNKDPEREFTSDEISDHLRKTVGSCSVVLRTLRKHNEVEYRRGLNPSGGGMPPYYYKHKVET